MDAYTGEDALIRRPDAEPIMNGIPEDVRDAVYAWTQAVHDVTSIVCGGVERDLAVTRAVLRRLYAAAGALEATIADDAESTGVDPRSWGRAMEDAMVAMLAAESLDMPHGRMTRSRALVERRVAAAVRGGMSEAEAARRSGVTRMTVRSWLGK